MDVPTLARAVVEAVSSQQERMRQPMLWVVTDLLLEYERCCNTVRQALEDSDMALMTLGVKRNDPTRKRIAAALASMEALGVCRH